MHRDEVRAFRGSAEGHLMFLIRLRGPEALRDALDAGMSLSDVHGEPPRLEYHPYRDRRWRRAVDRLAVRLGDLWDAFGCMVPAFIMWLFVAPRLAISPAICVGVGVAMVLMADYVATRSIEPRRKVAYE